MSADTNIKLVYEQEYRGHTIQIELGTSGRYRYIILNLCMGDMRFIHKNSCLQEAFRKVDEHESRAREYSESEEINKILDELKNILSSVDSKMASMRNRIQQLEEIIVHLEEEE